MRNLWTFLYGNRAFVWFLIFETLAFVLIVKFNPYHGGIYLNTSNQVVGGLYLQKSKVESYLFLKKTNESLARENLSLRSLLKSSGYDSTNQKKTIKDSTFHQQYTYTLAHVVNNTTTQRNNYLTLDKGKLAGIVNGNGVIFSGGLVGVVKDVSPYFCVVLSILHSESRVSVRIKHTKNIGSLFWEGTDNQILTIKDVPNYVDLKKGDTIETSGFSFFPEGIPVGTVISSSSRNGESSAVIKMKILSDLNKLDQVYIVNDKHALEKNTLETTAEK